MRYRRPIYIAPGSKYAAWKRQAAAAKAALQAHAAVMATWTEAERQVYFTRKLPASKCQGSVYCPEAMARRSWSAREPIAFTKTQPSFYTKSLKV